MATELVPQTAERGLAVEAPHNPWATHGLLKPFAAGEVVARPRVDALATISAGYRGNDGFPVVSRDGTIHVAPPSGQAPGLEEALRQRGGKGLTIALVHNNPDEILQQRFAAYSKTRVEAHGDGRQITVIHLDDTGRKDKNGKPIYEPRRETVVRAENPTRYAQLAESMKVQTSMYFALAYWTSDKPPRPRLYFPDGLGLYRLRFTSLNSAEAIRGALYHVASMNGGVVAGVPLELSIVYQDVAGPDGARRNVPIWSLRLLPPETIQLEPNSVRAILSAGAEQARLLQIAAPAPETLELAEYEGPDVDLDDSRIVDGQVVTPTRRAVDQAAGGGPIRDPKAWRKSFMISVRGSSLADDENRHTWISAVTHGRYDSLTSFSEHASLRDGMDLMKAAADWVNKEVGERMDARAEQEASAPQAPPAEVTAQTAQARSRYQQLFGDDGGGFTPTEKVHNAAVLTGAHAAAAGPERLDPTRQYTRAELFGLYDEWAVEMRRLDTAFQPDNVKHLPDVKLRQAVMDLSAQATNVAEFMAANDEDDDDAEDTE